MQLDALALLDIEGSERFALSEAHTADLVAAQELPWELVVAVLGDGRLFMETVAQGRPLPGRQVALLQGSWAAQQGLVDGNDLQRLLWTLRHFRAEVEYDLLQHVGVRLGDLWRSRQWRLLLNLVDRLPRATWTRQAMSNDPQYAAMLSTALAGAPQADDDDRAGPSLLDFTPEVAALASVVDAVNALRATFVMANSAAGAPAPKIPPYPRPRTLVDTMVAKAQDAARWAAHESLANRLLTRRKQP